MRLFLGHSRSLAAPEAVLEEEEQHGRGGLVYVSEHLPQEQTYLMFTGNTAVVFMREPL